MDNSRALTAAVTGAVIGGFLGYLFFTDRGRWLRRQFEPALDDLARELSSFRQTVEKAANVAGEGWKLLNGAMGPVADVAQEQPRFQTPHQTHPF